MTIKAIIFDLDGTLLNTIEDLADSTNFALSQCGFSLRTLEEINSFVGNGVSKLIERSVPNGKNNPKFQACLLGFKEHYKNNMQNKTKPYEGILELLHRLKEQGIKTAVVSNKFDDAVKGLVKKYFDGLIDVAAGENEEKGIRKKPFPDMVLAVIDELKIKPDEAIFVGDSDVDILTAKNSNMPCVSVSWGFRPKEFLIENGAKIIIDKPSELNDEVLLKIFE